MQLGGLDYNHSIQLEIYHCRKSKVMPHSLPYP